MSLLYIAKPYFCVFVVFVLVHIIRRNVTTKRKFNPSEMIKSIFFSRVTKCEYVLAQIQAKLTVILTILALAATCHRMHISVDRTVLQSCP